MQGKAGMLKSINKKVDKISLNMEKSKMNDYVNYLEHPRKLLFSNFLGGLARGFGIAVGFTILGAIGLYFLQMIVMWKLPVIGKFISEIVEIVQEHLKNSGGKIDG